MKDSRSTPAGSAAGGTGSSSRAVRRKAGAVGFPLPGTAVDLVEGELVVGSDHVFAGYWNNPAETAKTLCEGRVHTGDLARVDETDPDGFPRPPRPLQGPGPLPHRHRAPPELDGQGREE
ncbi:MAG: AMP-binding protein [Planctomycetes bacterium]|nr:AMP-binding protein [Planctomycetota bacterium]